MLFRVVYRLFNLSGNTKRKLFVYRVEFSMPLYTPGIYGLNQTVNLTDKGFCLRAVCVLGSTLGLFTRLFQGPHTVLKLLKIQLHSFGGGGWGLVGGGGGGGVGGAVERDFLTLWKERMTVLSRYVLLCPPPPPPPTSPHPPSPPSETKFLVSQSFQHFSGDG